MIQLFTSTEMFNEEMSNVYEFFNNCYETIQNHLKENGDIELSEDEQSEYKFSFFCKDGVCVTKAIRLDDKDNVYLDTIDEGGEQCSMYWEDINNDLIIIELIMEKIFE